MSEIQLREAYTLMKQGDKTGASRLVQDVLRQDRTNLNAWWLMSHLLEDEAKIVKSLENVLAINPEHLGARKRLSELRPEYSHLYEAGTSETIKSKTDQQDSNYWNKLNNPASKTTEPLNLSGFGYGLAMRFIVFFIFVGIGVIGSFFNAYRNSDSDTEATIEPMYDRYGIMARMENTPESVTQAFSEAYYREDGDTLYAISCEDYRPEIDDLLEDFDSPQPENITIDFSETHFVLNKVYSTDTYAFVGIYGITHIQDGGIYIETDWNGLADADGYDSVGHYLQKIDGSWKICDAR